MNFDLNKTTTLLSEKAMTWYEASVKALPNIVVAILVFCLFIVFSKLIKNLVNKILPRVTKNKAVINLLNTIASFATLAVGLFIALGIMNLDKTVTSILAGAGVLGLALGFAFQEIASNFVSGIFIAFREPYQIGDIVEIDDYFGEVASINLRTTNIMTFTGLEVLVPNKLMFTKPFINLTTTPKRRVDISVGVSYGDDLSKVVKLTKEALEKIEERIESEEVEVYFEEFGSSSINLSARFWIHYPANKAYLKAKHQAVMNIKSMFDENDINIPFPIRTLDFGIKGGVPLSGELSHNGNQES